MKKCSKCSSIYDGKKQVFPNADEEAGLRFHCNWICPVCNAKEEIQKLLLIADNMPKEFINFDNISFYNDKIIVRYKMYDDEYREKEIKLL